jgi:Flp pilus assembly protein TadG
MTSLRGSARLAEGGRRRGQALIEMALVVVALVFLMAGIVEFGRAFMLANMITHAARDGARFAATLGGASRTNGALNSTGQTSVKNHVIQLVQGVMPLTANDVGVTSDGASCPPTVTVTVNGTIDYLLLKGLVGNGFNVARSITFRDELAAQPPGC